MSDTTQRLSLPYILPGQAQKHVTHNEAIRALDSLIHASVLGRNITALPSAVSNGDYYLIGDQAGGVFAGKDNQLAGFVDGAWMFHPPVQGLIVNIEDEALSVIWRNGAWQDFGAGGVIDVSTLSFDIFGINGTADNYNRLLLNSAASLFNHDGAGHQLKINKSGQADTASVLFQTGFSGRAEMGLAGEDDFSFKVSPDGTNWSAAITIDAATGKADFPNTNIAQKDVLNLYPSHGRFALERGITISAFVAPNYYTYGNGTIISEGGKFIHNNNIFGGTSGTMNTDAVDLISKIRSPAHKRYGVEFYIAKFSMGATTTGSPLNDGSSNYYYSLVSKLTLRPSALTTHHYVRAITTDIMYRAYPGQTLFIDGVKHTTSQVISPSDGWVSVSIQDNIDPYNSFGYQPNFTAIHCKTAGDEYLIACPCVTTGLINVDVNAGLIMSFDNWS